MPAATAEAGGRPVADPRRHVPVHVLQVRMDDTQGTSGQRERVCPADQQVPRVQAQVYRGALEHAPYGIGAFDQGADVRVQARWSPGGASQRAPPPPGWRAGVAHPGVQLEGLA